LFRHDSRREVHLVGERVGGGGGRLEKIPL
jgi:hypothetical protein